MSTSSSFLTWNCRNQAVVLTFLFETTPRNYLYFSINSSICIEIFRFLGQFLDFRVITLLWWGRVNLKHNFYNLVSPTRNNSEMDKPGWHDTDCWALRSHWTLKIFSKIFPHISLKRFTLFNFTFPNVINKLQISLNQFFCRLIR